MKKEISPFSRWVSLDCKVWEKREWGWKFIGISKSIHILHVMQLISTDWDHPDDVYKEEE